MYIKYKTILSESVRCGKNDPVDGDPDRYWQKDNLIDFMYTEVFKNIKSEHLLHVVGYLLCYLISILVWAKILKALDVTRLMEKIDKITKPDAHHFKWLEFEVIREEEDETEAPR